MNLLPVLVLCFSVALAMRRAYGRSPHQGIMYKHSAVGAQQIIRAVVNNDVPAFLSAFEKESDVLSLENSSEILRHLLLNDKAPMLGEVLQKREIRLAVSSRHFEQCIVEQKDACLLELLCMDHSVKKESWYADVVDKLHYLLTLMLINRSPFVEELVELSEPNLQDWLPLADQPVFLVVFRILLKEQRHLLNSRCFAVLYVAAELMDLKDFAEFLASEDPVALLLLNSAPDAAPLRDEEQTLGLLFGEGKAPKFLGAIDAALAGKAPADASDPASFRAALYAMALTGNFSGTVPTLSLLHWNIGPLMDLALESGCLSQLLGLLGLSRIDEGAVNSAFSHMLESAFRRLDLVRLVRIAKHLPVPFPGLGDAHRLAILLARSALLAQPGRFLVFLELCAGRPRLVDAAWDLFLASGGLGILLTARH